MRLSGLCASRPSSLRRSGGVLGNSATQGMPSAIASPTLSGAVLAESRLLGASVRGVGRVNRDVLDQDDPVYSYGGEDYIIRDLGQLVGHPPARAEGQLQMPLLLIRAGDLRAAVSVDQVLGNREIADGDDDLDVPDFLK